MLALLALLSTVGPSAHACPPGAAVVRDAQTLHERLREGDPVIWISGTVEGDFVATRHVELHGCEDARLRGSGRGTVLRLHGDDLLVEDLRIEHSGNRVSSEDGALKVSGQHAVLRRLAVHDCLYGIALEQCHACRLLDSRVEGRAEIAENQRGDGIKLWEAHGSFVQRNVVRDVRDVVVWYSRAVTLEDNEITRGRYGTHFMYAHDAVVRRSVLRDNTVGIFVMYSNHVHAEDNQLAGARGAAGMGIGFKEADAVSLRRNAIVANTIGIYLDFTPRDPSQVVMIEDNDFALNGIALRTHGSERGAQFLHNDFVANDALLDVDGNGDARAILFAGNHFQDYAGYDLDRDGVGDVPFQLKSAGSDLRSGHPGLRFFQGTLALGLFDAVATALPYLGARVLLQDETPSIRPLRELLR